MTKRHLAILGAVLLALVVPGFVAYRASPPYYLQAQAHFWLTSDELRDLRQQFERDTELESVALIAEGVVEAKVRGSTRAEAIVSERGEMYERLMNEVRTSPILKAGDQMLFYIGSSRKFGRSFDIAYVYGASRSPNCASDLFKATQRGECYVPLEEGWAIHYQWTE